MGRTEAKSGQAAKRPMAATFAARSYACRRTAGRAIKQAVRPLTKRAPMRPRALTILGLALSAGALEGGDTNMRAIGYRKASPALDALEAFEIAKPASEGRDLLVEVRRGLGQSRRLQGGERHAARAGPNQRWLATTRPAWWRRRDRRRGCSSRVPKFSTPAASAGRGRIRNIIRCGIGSTTADTLFISTFPARNQQRDHLFGRNGAVLADEVIVFPAADDVTTPSTAFEASR
jgi:hypothetical protein